MIHQSWKLSHYKLFSLMGICVLLAFVLVIPAQGATYYVATAGNDSHPGTVNQPFKTFKKGVSILQPGDTLYIRGGVYTEQIDLQSPNKTGTAGNYITIAGYPGETVTIQYTDPVPASYGPIKARGQRGHFIFENLVLDGINTTDETKWQIRDGNHHFILRNIDIKNFKTSALFIMGDDITIQNCLLHDSHSTGAPGTRGYGIYLSRGSRILIEGNDIYNMPGGGIQIYPGPLNNVVVRNNKIHDNNDYEKVHIGGIVVSTNLTETATNVSIYNNLIYDNGSAPTSGSAPGIRISGAGVSKVNLWNNTIYNNKGYGVAIGTGINIVVQNNIVFGNAKGEIVDQGIGTMLDHNIISDPKFLKPEAHDFRLQPRSPAVDGGADLRQVATDFNKTLRPLGAAYDIGAYEGEVTDIKALQVPQNLAIR